MKASLSLTCNYSEYSLGFAPPSQRSICAATTDDQGILRIFPSRESLPFSQGFFQPASDILTPTPLVSNRVRGEVQIGPRNPQVPERSIMVDSARPTIPVSYENFYAFPDKIHPTRHSPDIRVPPWRGSRRFIYSPFPIRPDMRDREAFIIMKRTASRSPVPANGPRLSSIPIPRGGGRAIFFRPT